MHLRLRPAHVIIPLVTLAVGIASSTIAREGMTWYTMLFKPSWTPAPWGFGAAWTTIYILATASALLVYEKGRQHQKKYYKAALWLFAVNALLTFLWTLFFFYFHEVCCACVDAWLLCISAIALVAFSWRSSRLAAYLLIPYLLWIVFATYLNLMI